MDFDRMRYELKQLEKKCHAMVGPRTSLRLDSKQPARLAIIRKLLKTKNMPLTLASIGRQTGINNGIVSDIVNNKRLPENDLIRLLDGRVALPGMVDESKLETIPRTAKRHGSTLQQRRIVAIEEYLRANGPQLTNNLSKALGIPYQSLLSCYIRANSKHEDEHKPDRFVRLREVWWALPDQVVSDEMHMGSRTSQPKWQPKEGDPQDTMDFKIGVIRGWLMLQGPHRYGFIAGGVGMILDDVLAILEANPNVFSFNPGSGEWGVRTDAVE